MRRSERRPFLATVRERRRADALRGVLAEAALLRVDGVVDLVDDILLEPGLHLVVEHATVVERARLVELAAVVRRRMKPTDAPLAGHEARAVVDVGEVVHHLLDALDREAAQRALLVARPPPPLLDAP